MSGLSPEAREMLDLIRRIGSDADGGRPVVRRGQIDVALERTPGNAATRSALKELDAIGDLENVTRSGSGREPISFTLA
ncbi:MAG TPA: hypothetical protein VK919_06395 [Solirubrobacterales bacterium]|nr:hypothetical protein [Solirubrobacterales bacterium]